MTPAQAMLLFEAHRVRAFAIGLVGVATLGAIVVWRLGGAPLGQLVHGLALATTALVAMGYQRGFDAVAGHPVAEHEVLVGQIVNGIERNGHMAW